MPTVQGKEGYTWEESTWSSCEKGMQHGQKITFEGQADEAVSMFGS